MNNWFVLLCIAAFALCVSAVSALSREAAASTHTEQKMHLDTTVQKAEPANDAFIQAGSRYALVIGNDTYPVKPLNNPLNDANDTKAVLEKLGFHVDIVRNSDLSLMLEAVSRLGENLRQSADSVGFFYYSGHGIQAEGKQYLIPAKVLLTNESQLQEAALPVDRVLDELQGAGNMLVIAVFDTGRADPFSDQLNDTADTDVLLSQPPHSIVIYATGAGKDASDGKGRNGLFTEALLQHLQEPGLELKDVFNRTVRAVKQMSKNRQIPTMYAQFSAPVYLAGRSMADEQLNYLSQDTVSVLPVLDTNQIQAALIYPEHARNANVHGSVVLELFIDSSGAVRQINVLQEEPLGWGFADAAVAAFSELHTNKPAEIDGVRVAIRYRYPVHFTLR